jgi:hypothetical protein
MSELERSILKTIIYFDLFEYPLTSFEIWKWLNEYKCDLYDVLQSLDKSENLKRYIETRNGFYFLKGRKNIVETRKIRRDISILKWKRAMLIAKFLRLFPFVKMVSVCNSMGQFNLKEYSDIDLFIIIKSGYLWFTRFFITLILQVFLLRRHGKKINNRACLSFYITDNNLNLEYVAYEKDIYLCYWIISMMPIFDNNIYNKFIEANEWVRKFVPNFIARSISDVWSVKDTYLSKNIRNIKEFFLDNKFGRSLNRLFKKFEMKRILSHKNSKYYSNTKDVIVSDNILKFHEKDLRIYYRDIFLSKISKI